MLTDEERKDTKVPVKELRKARVKNGADEFALFRFDPKPILFMVSSISFPVYLILFGIVLHRLIVEESIYG